MQTVSLSLSAKSAIVEINVDRTWVCCSTESLICNATAVSTISLDVAPRWMHQPASPACSAIALVSAIMSCRVSASISSTLSLVTLSGLEIAAITS